MFVVRKFLDDCIWSQYHIEVSTSNENTEQERDTSYAHRSTQSIHPARKFGCAGMKPVLICKVVTCTEVKGWVEESNILDVYNKECPHVL